MIDWHSRSGSLHLYGSTPVKPGQWYHIAMVKQDRAVVVYVNGVPDSRAELADGSLDFAMRNATPLIFDASHDGSEFFHGKLDEILINNRALTALDVRNLYQMREAGICRI